MTLARDRRGDGAPRQPRCVAPPEMVGRGWTTRRPAPCDRGEPQGPLALALASAPRGKARHARGRRLNQRRKTAGPHEPWESGSEARRDRRKLAGKAPMPRPPTERVSREDSPAIPVVGPAREQRQGACCALCLAERIRPCASDTRRGCDEDTRVWRGERLPRRAHRCRARTRARPVGTAPGRGRGRGRRATRRAPATRLPRPPEPLPAQHTTSQTRACSGESGYTRSARGAPQPATMPSVAGPTINWPPCIGP